MLNSYLSFSSLNFSLVPNVVESGTLMFGIQVSEVTDGVGHRSLQLGESGQSSLPTLDSVVAGRA